MDRTAGLSGYLGAGHLDTTTEPDLLAWAIILWLLVKLLAGGDRRLWLAVGVVTGIGLENKDTLLFLGAGLAVALVLARRWDVVRSPWAWAAIGIALLLWAPNVAWQAANGWPPSSWPHARSSPTVGWLVVASVSKQGPSRPRRPSRGRSSHCSPCRSCRSPHTRNRRSRPPSPTRPTRAMIGPFTGTHADLQLQSGWLAGRS